MFDEIWKLETLNYSWSVYYQLYEVAGEKEEGG